TGRMLFSKKAICSGVGGTSAARHGLAVRRALIPRQATHSAKLQLLMNQTSPVHTLDALLNLNTGARQSFCGSRGGRAPDLRGWKQLVASNQDVKVLHTDPGTRFAKTRVAVD